MHGVTRVVIFCSMTIILPSILIIIPLYLKHQVFADKRYSLFESDVVAISEGMSSIFCQSHTLRMNISFNAFQVKDSPHISRSKRKHLRLKKSMTLPDDTLEYWGFYLLKGATVSLKVCSRYDGSRLLVVRGDRILQTCGLLQHNQKKIGANMDQDYKQVKVTFETKQEIYDDHNTSQKQWHNTTNLHNNTKIKLSKQHRNHHHNKNIRNSTNQSTTEAQVEYVVTTISSDNVSKRSTHHHLRHEHKKHKRKDHVNDLEDALYNEDNSVGVEEVDETLSRHPRDIGQQLDGRIEHGGNAMNYSFINSDESVSSFEMGLLTCYDGSILLTQEFDPSHLCTDINYLDNGDHMETKHEVVTDGYYYYIFYSDNDLISNDMHAVFDIYKPTLQFGNYSEKKACINETECTFPVVFWSDETVIVEVPTKDGIEVHEDDVAFLVSICHPRMGVYIIFPITVLFIILGCAFL